MDLVTTTSLTAARPLVSVVTPAHDVEAYLEEAVASVLGQTERDLEHIVVDDGSTDATLPLATRLATTDPRLRVLGQRRGGSGSARNAGLALARGRYVSFLDADDRWRTTKLERQLEILDRIEPHHGAVFCHSAYVDDGGRPTGRVHAPAPGSYDLTRLLVENCPPGNGSSLLLRREVFDEAGGFDEGLRSAVDFEMWLRIAGRSSTPGFWCHADILVDYRSRARSISSDVTGRVRALEVVHARHGGGLTPTQRALAMVEPALLAYQGGEDGRGRDWGGLALSGGVAPLLARWHGRRLLLWHLTGPRRVRALRHALLRLAQVPAAARRGASERRASAA